MTTDEIRAHAEQILRDAARRADHIKACINAGLCPDCGSGIASPYNTVAFADSSGSYTGRVDAKPAAAKVKNPKKKP